MKWEVQFYPPLIDDPVEFGISIIEDHFIIFPLVLAKLSRNHIGDFYMLVQRALLSKL